ncbi:hypothetical protein SISNIDRAFT_550190 [Sistotremastrum niveocremeum HHB9708]|uniref:Integral membrane protein n=2 Tax=Sistotremastraceae TaxID=3402574 RepID=A0A164UGF9_9AGAM|nr:hypothetical protein SISNIDRAFT_550190 [Sistotremastrum niveocremeum HHB9708]KZT42630.1 hypothetical protein SISSUDRAFT_1112501 [Sistotremastrum suecicum HHB10207 ss-3]
MSTFFHHELHPALSVVPGSQEAPLPGFKPTRIRLARTHTDLPEGNELWTSRDHRKNRHQQESPLSGNVRQTDSVWGKLGRMLIMEYWNVSWWVAVMFTVGSVVWVVNGFLVFLPFVNSHYTSNPDAIGWSGWVGATIFEVGSIFLIWEAWNRNDAAYFGQSVEKFARAKYHPDVTGKGFRFAVLDEVISIATKEGASPVDHTWIWFTLDTKYWREIGFVAGFTQLCAASIFWTSGLTGLPGIQEHLAPHWKLQAVFFWTPQVVGGSGFIISSALYMLETQKKWYIPEPFQLGWHIGFWNLIGGIGFTLCAAFGYSTQHWAEYQSSLSTFWGSWAFLIGSAIQWYEAVNPCMREG